jgi:hypothetical protein
VESTNAGSYGTERVSLLSAPCKVVESLHRFAEQSLSDLARVLTGFLFFRYLYAPRLRAGIADVWQIPEVNDWWLPDDQGCPDIVKEIRALTEERTANPRDDLHEDIRDMKSVFRKINIDDAGSQSSPSVDSGLLTEPSPDQASSAQAWQQLNLQPGEDPPTWEPEGTR